MLGQYGEGSVVSHDLTLCQMTRSAATSCVRNLEVLNISLPCILEALLGEFKCILFGIADAAYKTDGTILWSLSIPGVFT